MQRKGVPGWLRSGAADLLLPLAALMEGGSEGDGDDGGDTGGGGDERGGEGGGGEGAANGRDSTPSSSIEAIVTPVRAESSDA